MAAVSDWIEKAHGGAPIFFSALGHGPVGPYGDVALLVHETVDPKIRAAGHHNKVEC